LSKPASERIDHTHRIALAKVVIQTLRQQGDPASVLALDESLHVPTPLTLVATIDNQLQIFNAFSHNLGQEETVGPNGGHLLSFEVSAGTTGIVKACVTPALTRG
jgi:hypothetical protein